MAMSAYYLKGVAPKDLQLWTIFKGCFPFLGMVIITLVLAYVEPRLVTYLPDQFFGNPPPMVIDPNDNTFVNPDIFK
jgi:TRAP-type mannitol/chloroaromatic compound transport system permease large subunit